MIHGTTNHSLFNLPVNGEFNEMDGPSLRAKQEEFKNVECIVLDEYACTSKQMLGRMDRRCRQFMVCDEFFGGLTVIMVGDPAQLPPVGGSQMFTTSTERPGELGGLAAYREFKKVHLLSGHLRLTR